LLKWFTFSLFLIDGSFAGKERIQSDDYLHPLSCWGASSLHSHAHTRVNTRACLPNTVWFVFWLWDSLWNIYEFSTISRWVGM